MIRTLLRTFALAGAILALPIANAQQIWQQREFFQNSESVASYFYSGGNVSGASKLELIDKKPPVDTSSFVTAPNLSPSRLAICSQRQLGCRNPSSQLAQPLHRLRRRRSLTLDLLTRRRRRH
jgi:hypothetical protein